jgi:hypothetical protein
MYSKITNIYACDFEYNTILRLFITLLRTIIEASRDNIKNSKSFEIYLHFFLILTIDTPSVGTSTLGTGTPSVGISLTDFKPLRAQRT